MSTKKSERQKEPVYCIGCGMLKDEAFCTHREVMAKDPIAPNKAQWARDVNKNNDCPYFVPISKPKVYCGQCGNHREQMLKTTIDAYGCSDIELMGDVCFAPENKKDTYMESAGDVSRKPSEINANNDCPWFKAKLPVLGEAIHVTNVTRNQSNWLANAVLTTIGDKILSEIAPKRPWWKFWQRKEA